MDREAEGDHASHEAGLVEALYSSPGTLVSGAVLGTLICLFCAYHTADPLFIVAACLGLALAGIRMFVRRSFFAHRKSSTEPIAYRCRAQAVALGTLACAHMSLTTAYAIVQYGHSPSEWALVCVTLTNGMGIVGRSFASSLAVRLQAATLCLPVAAAFFWSEEPLATLMAVLAVIMVFVIINFAAGPRNILLRSLNQTVETRRLSRTDLLTGLANRSHFFERGEAMLRDLHPDAEIGVAILDLDGLKRINDARGHRVGDRIIARIGRRIARAELGSVFCARLGGDEFGALWQVGHQGDASSEDVAALIAEKMNFTVHDNGHRIDVRTSAGIYIGKRCGLDLGDLIERADYAQYVAKRSPDARVALFNDEMNEAMLRRDILSNDLSEAIANGQIRAVFQPIVQASDARIVGFEALARWNHSELGHVPPDEFVALAETTGLIPSLTRVMLNTAVDFAATLPTAISVSVNLSARDLTTGTVVSDIRDALKRTDINPRRLILEVTETSLLEMGATVFESFHTLRQLGCKVALDDFGTGYSSLSYLQRLRFDIVKIDRAFVESCEFPGPARDILIAIKAMSDALKLKVVVEGVENAVQTHALRDELGFEYLQGFNFSKGLPAPEALHMARTFSAGDGETVNEQRFRVSAA
ncbi:EAL domain-containing protein [Rhizobiaceae bacterium]|nr:EAL domain-containing protein [Rhizobiaceae bacterium]